MTGGDKHGTISHLLSKPTCTRVYMPINVNKLMNKMQKHACIYVSHDWDPFYGVRYSGIGRIHSDGTRLHRKGGGRGGGVKMSVTTREVGERGGGERGGPFRRRI